MDRFPNYRKFLNTPAYGGMAAVQISRGGLNISDCNKTIHLDIVVTSHCKWISKEEWEESHDNMRYKIEVLEEALRLVKEYNAKQYEEGLKFYDDPKK